MELERQYKRVYDRDKNVYEAAMERLDYIFNNFDRIYLSFSGGKKVSSFSRAFSIP